MRGLFCCFELRSDDEDDTVLVSELASPSLNFRKTTKGGPLVPNIGFSTSFSYSIHGGFSVESGFEPGSLRLRSRDLITRTPRFPSKSEMLKNNNIKKLSHNGYHEEAIPKQSLKK
ncbi:hypothetical protein AVEN_152106-1 [Araneus ventricosus]|uniref:Uncharacterized protein n=1 Tax=Araneus ventricosus TaxID=182803 RepID=A0A4Y2SV19_ARAVE|nr:hypothetical protein AVEN_152106-1 [Araneus ventricosus]